MHSRFNPWAADGDQTAGDQTAGQGWLTPRRDPATEGTGAPGHDAPGYDHGPPGHDPGGYGYDQHRTGYDERGPGYGHDIPGYGQDTPRYDQTAGSDQHGFPGYGSAGGYGRPDGYGATAGVPPTGRDPRFVPDRFAAAGPTTTAGPATTAGPTTAGPTGPWGDRSTATGTDGEPAARRSGLRLPGPIGLASLVAALLVTFGVGAALFSPSFASGRSDQAGDSAPAPAGPVNAPEREVPGLAEPSPTLPPAPTPSATPAPERTTTKPKPKPKPTTTKATSRNTRLENQVTTLVNAERAKAGCGAVQTNEKLRKAARAHSQDMANQNYFSHDSLDGRSPWDRAKAAGYAQPIGENIAKGQATPKAVMEAWMNSEGHRRNIVNCDAKAVGVGLVYDGGTPIWTQLFGAV